MPNLYQYALTDEEIFENVFDDERYLMNHVVMSPGKKFPKHPTDAEVTIIVLRGTLTAMAASDAPIDIIKGQVLQIEKGTDSALSNETDEVCELLVLKVK